MINDAGKHEVKGEGFVAACRRAAWTLLGRPDGAAGTTLAEIEAARSQGETRAAERLGEDRGLAAGTRCWVNHA